MSEFIKIKVWPFQNTQNVISDCFHMSILAETFKQPAFLNVFVSISGKSRFRDDLGSCWDDFGNVEIFGSTIESELSRCFHVLMLEAYG